jgi:3-hydroxyacyl-[acyl-carrier-protein] dehydratase
MPGVLLIEGIAQTAGAICILSRRAPQPQLVYFMTIDECKFRKPVVPGDQVEYHVRKLRNRQNIWKFSGEARVAGVKVAEAIVSAMIADE